MIQVCLPSVNEWINSIVFGFRDHDESRLSSHISVEMRLDHWHVYPYLYTFIHTSMHLFVQHQPFISMFCHQVSQTVCRFNTRRLHVRWSCGHQVRQVGFIWALRFAPTRRPSEREHRCQQA